MLPRVLQTQARLQREHLQRHHDVEVGYHTFQPSILKPRRRQTGWQHLQRRSSLQRNATWMAKIDDDVLMSALTLPGAHDCAAFTVPWPFIQTQTMDVTNQLDAGIRYLDLRCGLRHDIIEMVHGPTILGITLEVLMGIVYEWLEAHSSEALVVQIKQDRKPEKSSVHFAHAISVCLAKKSERWRTANTTPRLGELRGKIQLFRRFLGPNLHAYGIDVTRWMDNPTSPFTIETQNKIHITIQDHYNFEDPEPLSSLIMKKGSKVSTLLELASTTMDSEHWFINFTSASEFNWSHQIPPREVAVGGWVGFQWEEGINPRLRAYLRNQKGKRRFGIIPMDFPELGTDDLITALTKTNLEPDSEYWKLLYWMPLVLLILFVSAASLMHTIDNEHWCPAWLHACGLLKDWYRQP